MARETGDRKEIPTMATDITTRAAERKQELLTDLRSLAALYDGADHGGTDANGIVDIEFPNMFKAAAFIEAAHLEDDALPRDPMPTGAMRTFNQPIVLQVPLLTYAMCR
jgi:hypothetical protein